MRATVTLLAVLGSLAACADRSAPPQAAATPPSISYRVDGADIAPANALADGYCRQYGMYANLQGVQPNGMQSVATYVRGGSRVSSADSPDGTYNNGAAPPYSAAAPYNSAPVP